MPTPSLAQNFFDRIVEAPDKMHFLAALADPNDPWFEKEWLEFKCAPDISANDTKENWSKALSGFANTSGGVLVWGIKARKDPESNVDRAHTTCLVSNPAELRTRLTQLLHQAADPPVLGVVIQDYADPETKKGFVVCLVPESEFRPHRAEYVENKPYYLRVADSFIVTPVSVLRSMFYPRSKSFLRAHVCPRSLLDGMGTRAHWHWLIRIENTGTATAKYVCVFVNSRLNLASMTLGRETTRGQTSFGAPIFWCERPIHPGGFHELFTYRESQEELTARAETKLFFHMYASDSEPQGATVSFTAEEAKSLDQIGRYGTPFDISDAKNFPPEPSQRPAQFGRH
jgi:hypothetical protein